MGVARGLSFFIQQNVQKISKNTVLLQVGLQCFLFNFSEPGWFSGTNHVGARPPSCLSRNLPVRFWDIIQTYCYV